MIYSPTLLARVDARRDRSGGADACWPQLDTRTRITYGLIKNQATEIRRAAWLLEHGELPRRYMHIEVTCGNFSCLNPKHMVCPTPEERFWWYVDKSGGPKACWPWTATFYKRRGYGQYKDRSRRPHPFMAHRYAYEITFGRIDDSRFYVCHHCDNPPCVNPAHLFLGDAKANNDDMWRKGRGSCGPRHAAIMRQARERSLFNKPVAQEKK